MLRALRLARNARSPAIQQHYRGKRTLGHDGKPWDQKSSPVPKGRPNVETTVISESREVSVESEGRSVGMNSPVEEVKRKLIHEIRGCLQREMRVDRIERFVHSRLDKALASTSSHSQLYEAVVKFLIRGMWAQPAATVYQRMREKGFISTDFVDVQMLVILLADPRAASEEVLERIQDIVAEQTFSESEMLGLHRTLDAYDIPTRSIMAILERFMEAKGEDFVPGIKLLTILVQSTLKLVEAEEIVLRDGETTRVAVALQDEDAVDLDAVAKLGIRLQRAAANPEMTEQDVLPFLNKMADLNVGPDAILSVVESFLLNRDADYHPSMKFLTLTAVTSIQAQKVEEAFKFLARYHGPRHSPHFAFLAALRDSRPYDNQSFMKLLKIMDEADIPVNTTMFNVIIAREVYLKRVPNALSLYQEMKANPNLHPDAFTYGSLFALYRRIRPHATRRVSAAGANVSPSLPLRQLHLEFIQATERRQNPIIPHTELLNSALRAFMRQRDYAGAITVIRTFSHFKVPLDQRTYYSVVKLLVRRVWKERDGPRGKHEVRWVDRFLGVQHYADIILNEVLVHRIFTAVRQKHFDVSAPLYVPLTIHGQPNKAYYESAKQKKTFTYNFPTMEMMESVNTPEPLNFVYDPVPLIRLLERAVFADLDVSPDEAEVKVYNSVREARILMLP